MNIFLYCIVYFLMCLGKTLRLKLLVFQNLSGVFLAVSKTRFQLNENDRNHLRYFNILVGVFFFTVKILEQH